jgi:hypothetical protein
LTLTTRKAKQNSKKSQIKQQKSISKQMLYYVKCVKKYVVKVMALPSCIIIVKINLNKNQHEIMTKSTLFVHLIVKVTKKHRRTIGQTIGTHVFSR